MFKLNFITNTRFLNSITQPIKFCMCGYFKKYIFTIMLGAWLALLLTGCNTVAGVGQDIQAGGNTVTTAAQKTSQALSGKKSPTPVTEQTKTKDPLKRNSCT